MANRDAPSATFNCHLCPSSFARQEHLTRHIRSHTNERPYKCTECGKCFSRQDVLNRHMSSHSAQAEGLRAASSRACTECAASRVRCSKNLPCNRCRQRSLECKYPIGRKRKASGSSPIDGVTGSPIEQESGESTSGSRDEQHMVDAAFCETSVASGHANTGHDPNAIRIERVVPGTLVGQFPNAIVWPSGLEGVDQGQLPPETASEPFPVPDLCGFMTDPSLGNPMVSTSGINWLSPQYPNTLDWEDQLAALPQFNTEFGFMNGLYAADATNNVTDNLVSQPETDGGYPVAPAPMTTGDQRRQHTEERSDRNSRRSSVRSGGALSNTSKSTEGTFYVEGTASRAPFRGRMLRRASSTSHVLERGRSGNALAAGMTRTPSNLPVMAIANPLISDFAYDNMRREIQARGERLDRNLADFPSLVCVEHYAQMYFELFHPAYPFVRKHALALDEPDNWILILAISAVGSIYARELHSSIVFNVFDKILEGIESSEEVEENDLWIPHDADHARSIDLPMMQAKILHLVCLLHGGKRGHTERGLRERCSFIDKVKGTSLLCPREDDLEVDSNSDEAAILSRWTRAESRVRTGMMIWLLDAMIASEFGCAPLLQFYDAKLPLPSQDYDWENPTMKRITDKTCSTATISEAIDILYMEKRLPPNLGEFSNVLLIYAVCRRTNEAIYQYQTRLPSWVPDEKVQARSPCEQSTQTWPPSLPILSKWRNSACDCLDILHWNANGIAAKTGGWEHPTILHLHLSRLLLLTPTQHMQYVAAGSASVARGGKMGNKKYLEARSHLFQWAIRDQFKARLSMVHAGALLWHVRRYSGNNFLEPFSIYLATLAIWSYSVSAQSFRPQSASGAQISGSTGGSTGTSNENTTPSQMNGISPNDEMDEDPEPSFIHLDRPCDDEMVQVYVRLGHKMNGYMLNVGDICSSGAPERILKEGVRLLSIDRYYHSKGRQQEHVDKTRDVLNIWEIEKSYAEILNCLSRVTKTDLMA